MACGVWCGGCISRPACSTQLLSWSSSQSGQNLQGARNQRPTSTVRMQLVNNPKTKLWLQACLQTPWLHRTHLLQVVRHHKLRLLWLNLQRLSGLCRCRLQVQLLSGRHNLREPSRCQSRRKSCLRFAARVASILRFAGDAAKSEWPSSLLSSLSS